MGCLRRGRSPRVYRRVNMAERCSKRDDFMNGGEVELDDKWQATKSQPNKRTVGNDVLLQL